jgi:hypothetical protein
MFESRVRSKRITEKFSIQLVSCAAWRESAWSIKYERDLSKVRHDKKFKTFSRSRLISHFWAKRISSILADAPIVDPMLSVPMQRMA